MKKQIVKISVLVLIAFYVSSCQSWDNFITYFNTYYNAERIMGESEMEFSYFDDKVRVIPRVIVPEPDIFVRAVEESGPPLFMEEFIIRKHKRQPVEVKLDSIIIKGSKILAKHPHSNYIQGTLYLMAKSYFYQEEWLPSQIKCIELIDRFPDGEMSPDAHLLLSKNLLIQRKFETGKIMLSRTVDIAWQLQRYDILAEAFRLEADLALFQGDKEGALRPYKQAIVQSGDSRMKAKWQIELASLLYRIGDFERASEQFALSRSYRPDYLARFESYLYEGASYARLGRYKEAEDIFRDLYNDGKYTEWQGFVAAQQLSLMRQKINNQDDDVPIEITDIEITDEEGSDAPVQITEKELVAEERKIDSMFVNNTGLVAYYYERGMDKFNDDNYSSARNYFNKARITRTTVFEHSKQMFDLTNTWQMKHSEIRPLKRALNEEGETVGDSLMNVYSNNLFVLGRTHEKLGNPDSALFYFKLSAENAPLKYAESARYLYSYSRVVKNTDPYKADSLLEVIINTHPLTPYGEDARNQLGFTEAFIIDSVAELYSSGDKLRKHGDNYYAINQFLKIYTHYPSHKLAPKAIYTIGWINEQHDYPDIALDYYKILLREYPRTEYAEDIRLTVAYMDALASDSPLPDSLKEKKTTPRRASKDKKLQADPNFDPSLQPGGKPDEAMDPNRLLKDPGSVLKDPGALIGDPKEMLKNLKIPDKKSLFSLPKLNIDAEKLEEDKIPVDTTKTK